MAEHRSESAQPLPHHADVLRCVTLPAVPTVYGLDDAEGGVTAWVFALPGGRAYIVPRDEEQGAGMIHPSLDLVMHRWAPRRGADLVLVTT